MYNIEAGILPKEPIKPIQNRSPGGGRPPKYPFSRMHPGDSFRFPLIEERHVKNAANSYQANVNTSVRFIFEREGEGWRCFCIAADHDAS